MLGAKSGGYRVTGAILALAGTFLVFGNLLAHAQERPALPEVARAPDHPVVVANSFIVQVADDQDPRGVATAVAATTGGEIAHVYSHAINGFSITVPLGIAIADIAAADDGVVLVEPNLSVYAFTHGMSVLVTGVDRIDADMNATARIDGVDGSTLDGERVDVDIAIIDSGIDLDHWDLNLRFCCKVERMNC